MSGAIATALGAFFVGLVIGQALRLRSHLSRIATALEALAEVELTRAARETAWDEPGNVRHVATGELVAGGEGLQ